MSASVSYTFPPIRSYSSSTMEGKAYYVSSFGIATVYSRKVSRGAPYRLAIGVADRYLALAVGDRDGKRPFFRTCAAGRMMAWANWVGDGIRCGRAERA